MNTNTLFYTSALSECELLGKASVRSATSWFLLLIRQSAVTPWRKNQSLVLLSMESNVG